MFKKQTDSRTNYILNQATFYLNQDKPKNFNKKGLSTELARDRNLYLKYTYIYKTPRLSITPETRSAEIILSLSSIRDFYTPAHVLNLLDIFSYLMFF